MNLTHVDKYIYIRPRFFFGFFNIFMYAKVRILTHKVSTVLQTLDFILQIPKLLSTKKIGMQKNNPLLETVFQSFGMRFQMKKSK